MASVETKISIRHAFESLKGWVSMLGVIVAAVSICNFIYTNLSMPLSTVVDVLLSTYRLIVHGAIDWILFFIGISIPPWLKDFIFMYMIIGGSFMRSRMREGMYREVIDGASLWRAIKIVSARVVRRSRGGISTMGRMTDFYQESPLWVRRAMDTLLWPRVAIQYFSCPRVYRNDYLGTRPSFPVGYSPGERKIFLYDKRHILYMQISATVAATIFILVVNGFLAIPKT